MEIYLKKTLSGLKPLYDSDADQLAKIKIGEDVLATIKRPRNLRFHKKFFALLNLGFQNQDRYADFETFRFVMIMKSGFYIEIDTGKGSVFMPRSI